LSDRNRFSEVFHWQIRQEIFSKASTTSPGRRCPVKYWCWKTIATV